MTPKDLQFLLDFSIERQTQETDGNAQPVYWSIAETQERVTDSDFCEKVIYGYQDGDEVLFKTKDELFDFLKENLEDDVFSKINAEYRDNDDLDEIIYSLEYTSIHELNKHGLPGTFFTYSMEILHDQVRNDTMFLLKSDAKRHLETNKHNLKSSAHTYAMTAFRSGKTERFLELIGSTEFQKFIKKHL